jgi:hypothetical protein
MRLPIAEPNTIKYSDVVITGTARPVPQGALEPVHLELVDGPDAAEIRSAHAASPLADEAHEDFLKRALVGVEVLEGDAELAHSPEQRGNARALRVAVIFVMEFASVRDQPHVPVGELRGYGRHRLGEVQRQLLLAELLHQLRLLLHQDQFAFSDDADAVRHLLRFLDIMSGEDDRDAAFLRRWTSCHMSRRSSTSTPAVGSSRNRICGSCASALAIITRRFMPPESSFSFSFRFSHKERSRRICSMRAGSRGRP